MRFRGLKKIFIAASLALGLSSHAETSHAAPPAPVEISQSFQDAAESKRNRPLTEGEIAMAKSIFGNSIDYDRVKMSSKNFVLSNGKTAHTLHNRILMGDRYSDDYATADLKLQGLFIHEMTHVWEYQNKVYAMLREVGTQFVGHGFNYHKLYAYTIDPTKDFMDYNYEQQGDILEYYHTHRNLTAANFDTPELFAAHQAEMKVYEKVLENFLIDPAYAKNWRDLSEYGREQARKKWPKPPAL